VTRRGPEPECARRMRRRDLFSALGGLVVLDVVSAGCRREAPLGPGEFAVQLDALAEGKRVVVYFEGNPVEVLRAGASVRARSLRCTHWGCVVRWHEEQRQYVCPCHDGRYDESGAVVAGPPPTPLRDLPVRMARESVVIGPPTGVLPAGR
jgi:Rieske Fe-S protein